MPFQFVDNNSAIDSSTRRRIRSHVAIGRNVGKTRPSKKRTNELSTKKPVGFVIIPDIENNIDGLESNQYGAPKLYHLDDDVLSGCSFLHDVTPVSRDLAKRAFSFFSVPPHTPELSNAIDSSEIRPSIWSRFMFLDQAYFHCAIAVSLIATNKLSLKPEDPPNAIHHQSRSLRLLNERLSGPDAVADATIAVVVALTQYDRLKGHYYGSLAHIVGLQRMVELRGGISQLVISIPGVAQKIFRADLEYSIHLGTATRFSIEEVMQGTTALIGISKSIKEVDDQRTLQTLPSRLYEELSAELLNLLIDVTELASQLNDASAKLRPKLNSYSFHDTLLLLGYRLVHISPLGGPRPANRLQNVIHLALGGFIVTFLRGLDHKIPYARLLSELTTSAAQNQFDNNQESQEILLWLLFVGGISVFGESDYAWLIPKINQTTRILGLFTWKDVTRKLAKFPWVNDVHDKSGQALWYRSSCC